MHPVGLFNTDGPKQHSTSYGIIRMPFIAVIANIREKHFAKDMWEICDRHEKETIALLQKGYYIFLNGKKKLLSE